MRKKVPFFAGLLCLCSMWAMHAQQDPHINYEFENQRSQMFAGLNKESVPHGILLDYAYDFTNVELFNGTIADSLFMTAYDVHAVYQTLVTGVVSTTQMPLKKPSEFSAQWTAEDRATHTVTLSGMYVNYAKFNDENPNIQNLISVTDNVITDKYINGIWQNPYTTSKAFVLAPYEQEYISKNFKVKVPHNLFLTNSNEPMQLEIDFNDGTGFRTVEFDEEYEVSYATKGEKNWKYRFTVGGQINWGGSKIKIIDGLHPIPIDITLPFPSNLCGSVLQTKEFTAKRAFNGEKAKAKVTIDCSGDGIINNPLIVVEGFDFSNDLANLIAEEGSPKKTNGVTDYDSFTRTLILSGSDDLRDLIQNNGKQYDIFYVDWVNGADYMERNAYVLQDIIKWVNSIKQGNEPNVILGQSMGGIVTRYALTDMEERGEDYETNLFVSHDSPHQGANVPISYQFLFRDMANQYVNVTNHGLGILFLGIYDAFSKDFSTAVGFEFKDLLDQPAAKQLLKNWVNKSNDIDNTEHNNFYNTLKTKGINQDGYPALTRNIAISNGSECGITQQDLNPGDNLFDLNFDLKTSLVADVLGTIVHPVAFSLGFQITGNFKFKIAELLGHLPGKSYYIGDIKAKALYDSPSGGQQIYKSKLTYKKEILWLIPAQTSLVDFTEPQPSGLLPFDHFGGGYYPTVTNNTSIYINFTTKPQFSFIPTVSAIDVGKNNTSLTKFDYYNSYVGAFPPSGNKSTSFDSFSTEFQRNVNNFQHITFNSRNGNWLAAELEAARNSNNVPLTTDCSYFCSEDEIAGSNFICDNNNYTYSIPEFGDDVDIRWTFSGFQYVSGQGTSNLVVRNNGGINPKTISVRIESTQCGTFTLRKEVYFGIPTMSGSISGQTNIQVFSNQNYSLPLSYTAPNTTGATYYEWVLPLGYQVVNQFGIPTNIPQNWELLASTANSNTISVRSPLTGSGQIKVRACNECGCSAYSTLNVTHQRINTPGYELAPNPTIGDVLNVMRADGAPVPEFPDNRTDVFIYNLQSQRVHQFEITSEGGSTNVAHLAEGIYKVQIDMKNGAFEVLNLQISR